MMEIIRAGIKTTMEIDRAGIKHAKRYNLCYHTHNHAGVAGLQIMLINFHLSSKESRAQSNLFSNSISAALMVAHIYCRGVGVSW